MGKTLVTIAHMLKSKIKKANESQCPMFLKNMVMMQNMLEAASKDKTVPADAKSYMGHTHMMLQKVSESTLCARPVYGEGQEKWKELFMEAKKMMEKEMAEASEEAWSTAEPKEKVENMKKIIALIVKITDKVKMAPEAM